MGRIRNAVVKEIYGQLGKSHFCVEDFEVNVPEEGNTLFGISFRARPQYTFVANRQRDTYVTHEAPGNTYLAEVCGCESIEDCMERIGAWCYNIDGEMKASEPIYDELARLRDDMQDQIKLHVKDPDAHFLEEERASLEARLDEILSQMVALQEHDSITDAQLKWVQGEIESVRSDLESYPKGVWYRTAGNKVLNIMKAIAASRQVREFIMGAVVKLLPAGDAS